MGKNLETSPQNGIFLPFVTPNIFILKNQALSDKKKLMSSLQDIYRLTD